jgi:putative PEP-CTERM system TPR-repeat lipoprotein
MRLTLAALTVLLFCAGCDRFISVESRVQRAQAAADQGDYRTAAVELMNALKKEPGNGPARLLFAETVLWMGDAAGAERELARLPASVDAAKRAELAVRVDLALQRPEQAVQKLADPQTPVRRAKREYYRGLALMQLGRAGEAQRDFESAFADDPGLVAAASGACEALAAQGNRAAALSGLEKLTKEHPDSADAWLAYGMLLAGGGDVAGGANALDRANKLAPRQLEVTKQVMLLAALVEARLLEGKLDEARQASGALSRLAPNTPISLYIASRISMAANDYEAAVNQLRQVAQSAPRLYQARVLLAMALTAQGNLEQASQTLNDLLQEVPDHAGARQLLAQVRMRLDDPDGALRMLVPLLGGDSADVQANALIEAARSRLGAQQSVALLEKALSEDPKNAGLKAQLASAYLQANAPDKAAALLRDGSTDASSSGDLQRAALLLRALDAAEGPAAARAQVNALLAANPANAYVANLAAVYFAREGDSAAARAVLDRAVERGAAPADTLLTRAQIEWSAGQRPAAAAALDRLLALQPKNVLAHMAAGEIALAGGNLTSAETHFSRVLAERPDSVDARLRLAQLALAKLDTKRADEIAAEVVKLAPTSLEVRNALGMLYLNSGRADQALEHFRAATEANADSATTWLNLARTQRVLGQAGAARESLQRALKAQPDWLPATALLAMMDIDARDPDAALARVAALRKARPTDPDVDVLAGDVNEALQRHAEATAAYQKAYAARPSNVVAAKDYRARTAGKLPQTTMLLERWIESHPQEVAGRVLVAEAAVRNGERSRAISQYRAVLAAQPNNVVVLNNLAWVSFEAGDARALDLARQAAKLAPQSAAVNDTLGWILLQQGQNAEALKVLQVAVSQKDVEAEIHYHHAVALARNGQQAEAAEKLRKLLRDGGTFAGRAEAERMLGTLPGGPSAAP